MTEAYEKDKAEINSIKIEDAGAFKHLIIALDSLVNEAILKFNAEGISAIQMNPSTTAMIVQHIPKKAFSTWGIKKNGSIGINLRTLKEAFKKVNKGDKLGISTVTLKKPATDARDVVINAGTTVLQLSFSGKKGKKTEIVPYVVGMRPPPEKEPPADFTGSFTMNGKELNDILNKAHKLKLFDYLTIELKKGEVRFYGKGTEEGKPKKYEKVFKDKDIKVSTPVKVTFDLDLLRALTKAADKDTLVTAHVNTDHPLLLEYEILGGKTRYWLAPYITDDYKEPKKMETNSELKKQIVKIAKDCRPKEVMKKRMRA